MNVPIFFGVWLSLIGMGCAMEGIADRIRDHEHLISSEWFHFGIAFVAFTLAALSLSSAYREEK